MLADGYETGVMGRRRRKEEEKKGPQMHKVKVERKAISGGGDGRAGKYGVARCRGWFSSRPSRVYCE